MRRNCTSAPYAFHPEYSTANPRGNTWSAHTYNVAFSDEIGHFEHCNELDANFNCAVAGSDDETLDADDVFCVPGSDSLLVHINGCFAADDDFDGPSYQKDWPGTNPDVKTDQRLHPEPVIFTSPTTNGGQPLPDDRLRGRPACDRELLQHRDGSRLHKPAAGIAVLPVLLDPQGRRNVRLAGGRSLHPRHDQGLRWNLGEGVRNHVAAADLPGNGVHGGDEVRELQQRRFRQPLHGEVVDGSRRTPQGSGLRTAPL